MISKAKEKIENEEEDEEDYWEEIELIRGRLIGVSKARRTITLEVEEQAGSIDVFAKRYSVSEKMSDEDFDDICKLIGEQVEVVLKDEEVVKVKRE